MLLPALSLVLAALSCLSLYVYKFDFTAPAVLFSGGFFFSSLWAIAFSGVWGYRMHLNAFFAVGGGVAIFVVVSIGIRLLLFGGAGWVPSKRGDEDDPLLIGLLGFLVLQLVVLVWYCMRIQRMFPADSLSASIAAAKYAFTFTTISTNLGFPLQQMREFCWGGAYVSGYYAATGIARKRITAQTAVAILSALVNCMQYLAGGTRTPFAVYIITLLVLYMFERKERHEGSIAITFKMCAMLVLGVALFLLCFRLLAVGRFSNFYRSGSLSGLLSSLSVYAGSQIPNLDHWMQLNSSPSDALWGSMTFITSIHLLGAKLHIPGWGYTHVLPRVDSNWHWMGNVYTTFYDFLYDFGPIGLVACTAFMALAAELFFNLGGRSQRFRPFWKIMYAAIAPHLLLSFFSNRVYDSVLTLQFYRAFAVIVFMLFVLSGNWIAHVRSCFDGARRIVCSRWRGESA